MKVLVDGDEIDIEIKKKAGPYILAKDGRLFFDSNLLTKTDNSGIKFRGIPVFHTALPYHLFLLKEKVIDVVCKDACHSAVLLESGKVIQSEGCFQSVSIDEPEEKQTIFGRDLKRFNLFPAAYNSGVSKIDFCQTFGSLHFLRDGVVYRCNQSQKDFVSGAFSGYYLTTDAKPVNFGCDDTQRVTDFIFTYVDIGVEAITADVKKEGSSAAVARTRTIIPALPSVLSDVGTTPFADDAKPDDGKSLAAVSPASAPF